MRRIFLLLICLLCLANCCFAYSVEVETNYDVENNRIECEFDYTSKITQKTRLPKEGKTIIIQAFNYSRMYEFDDSYDIATGECNPRDLMIFLLYDYDSRLFLMEDNVLCTQVDTGKKYVLPVKRERKAEYGKDYDTTMYVISPANVPEFLELVNEEKALEFSFYFLGDNNNGGADYIRLYELRMHSASENLRNVLKIRLGEDDVKQLKSVVNYDLYQDATQTDNIKKAVAARKVK